MQAFVLELTDSLSLLSPKSLNRNSHFRRRCASGVPDFSGKESRLARKTGQIVGRGRHRWLVRVFLGRDRETRKRCYHNRIVHGPVRHAQTYLNKVLRDRDLGRQVDGADITLNEYLDRWLETAAKPRLREKSYRSYESLLRRYVRPSLGARNLAAISAHSTVFGVDPTTLGSAQSPG